MKKLAIIFGFLVPVLSFAGNLNGSTLDAYQEQCAKESDPVKRQNSCHMLDQHKESQAIISDYHQETATV